MIWNRSNYSQSDMLSMQQDAMNRVMEMQRRAQQHVSQSNHPVMNHVQEGNGMATETPSPLRQNFPENRNTPPPESPPLPLPTTQQNPPQHTNAGGENEHLLNLPFLPVNLLEKFNLDSERLILLGLGLVLLNEGGDRILLLALIYIFLN